MDVLGEPQQTTATEMKFDTGEYLLVKICFIPKFTVEKVNPGIIETTKAVLDLPPVLAAVKENKVMWHKSQLWL